MWESKLFHRGKEGWARRAQVEFCLFVIFLDYGSGCCEAEYEFRIASSNETLCVTELL